MYHYIIKASHYAIFEKLDLLCVELGQVLVEELPDVLHHGGACDLRDAGGLWGVGIVEGILHQATLTPIQVLHLLLAHHDFLETGEKGRRKGREVGKSGGGGEGRGRRGRGGGREGGRRGSGKGEEKAWVGGEREKGREGKHDGRGVGRGRET